MNQPHAFRPKALFGLLALAAAAGANAQSALKLEWVFSGPAIGGILPSGRAVLDQPSLPGKFHCEVKNVNLPDGTVLTVSLGGYVPGVLTLSRGEGKMDATIPFQFRNGAVDILRGTTVVMTGRFKI